MDLTGRIASLAAMGISSFLAPRIASAAWKLFTGEEPPSEEEGGKFLQIIAFAGLSAVLVSAIQFFTMKGANRVLPKAADSGDEDPSHHLVEDDADQAEHVA